MFFFLLYSDRNSYYHHSGEVTQSYARLLLTSGDCYVCYKKYKNKLHFGRDPFQKGSFRKYADTTVIKVTGSTTPPGPRAPEPQDCFSPDGRMSQTDHAEYTKTENMIWQEKKRKKKKCIL